MGRGSCLLKGGVIFRKGPFAREEGIYKSFIVILFLQNEETNLNKYCTFISQTTSFFKFNAVLHSSPRSNKILEIGSQYISSWTGEGGLLSKKGDRHG